MSAITFENPVFAAYAVASAIMVLKIMGQGWVTVWLMLRRGTGYASPEDLRPGLINRAPDPAQLAVDPAVDRSRRMHRNDLENIPAFWAAGLLLVLSAPPAWLAFALFYGFVAARLLHAWAYGTAQSHEVRATFYTAGSLIVIYMALHVLWVALA